MVYWGMVVGWLVERGVVECRQGVMMGLVESCCLKMMVAGKAMMASYWWKVWGVANNWWRWFVEMGSWQMGRGVE